MVTLSNRFLKVATVVIFAGGIVGFSDARSSVTMCNSRDFYLSHHRMCELWFDYGIRPRHLHAAKHPRPKIEEVSIEPPRPKIEFPAVQSYEMISQSITVRRDPQASNDFRPDQYIALQTPEDMTSSSSAYGFAGWFVSVFDLGRKHPPLYQRTRHADR